MGINLKRRTKLLMATGASVLAVGAIGGAAVAAGDGDGGPRGERAAAVSEYLGLSSDEVREARQGGTSLAELAAQQGKSVEGLEQTIVSEAMQHLEDAVDSGRISQDQVTDMLTQLEDRVSEIVQSTDAPERGGRGGGVVREAVTTYLDTPDEEIREARESGTSLAEIAQSEGKSVEGLEQSIMTAAEEKTAEAVADGRITQAEADERLADLEERVSETVNSTDAPERGHHGPGGPGGPPPADGGDGEDATGDTA